MNGILQNLIARHQSLMPSVEPRQRARFEPETLTAERSAVNELSTPTRVHASDERLQERNAGSEPAAPVDSVFSPPINPPQGIVPAETMPAFSVSQPRPGETLDAHLDAILSRMAATRPQTSDSTDPIGLQSSPATDIERLEAMIERLSEQPGKPDALAAAQPAAEFRREKPNADSGQESPSLAPLAKGILPAMPPEPSPSLRQQPALDLSRDVGALQIPSWVRNLQAELAQQSQQTPERSTPEPIVNVTIGRIEIRAEKKSALPVETRKTAPPTGILSLDDYLKQRNGRSRP